MPGSTFETHPKDLSDLLEECHRGTIQLPDFQRSWVWDEDRIKSLIASISRAFPVGALMSLTTGGEVDFKPRPIEGAPTAAGLVKPQALLLDGQQRMTSLYQVTKRGQVVETVTPKNKRVKRWFYIDIRKALDLSSDREEAILGLPEERMLKSDFGRKIELDLSTPAKEYENMMYPVNQVFDWDTWQDEFRDFWKEDSVRDIFKNFRIKILENFKYYKVPVLTLDRETSKEAVCVVFEKVNTGGKALDAFELVTAMYAASGHELRKDWFGDGANKGRKGRLSDALRFADSDSGILEGVSNTDFLQAISLFYSRERREAAEADGRTGKELPSVAPNRQALLNLPLSAYKKFESQVEEGFKKAAKFLYTLHIYRIRDLPYQSQLVPLASILADIGEAWEYESNRNKLTRWFWSGVFGELYGSAIESRFARDFLEVTAWLRGGPEPSTVTEATFRPDRLKSMSMRLSAAYKGLNALLMKEGAEDFRSGQKFDHTVFFNENVDIHHIFPQHWCKEHEIDKKVFDSIINKTPLSFRTNRIIGGDAPSLYLARLEKGDRDNPPIQAGKLDGFLRSHLIEPSLLRGDLFQEFMVDRQLRLLSAIEWAMGKKSYGGELTEEGEDIDVDVVEG